ncbi:hypothetical protein ACFL2A_06080, partial [Thermodesulfobacteriota bacterium]
MIDENNKYEALKREKKKRRRELIFIFLIFAIVFCLFYIRNRFFGTTNDYPVFFGILYIIIILILLLTFLIIRNVVKFFFERRRRKSGTKLRTKLSLAFILLSLIPTMLLFFASVSILKTSIESWFSSQVEMSLSESYKIAEIYYENVKAKSAHDVDVLNSYLLKKSLLNPSQNFTDDLLEILKEKRKELNFDAVELILQDNIVIKLEGENFPDEGY